MWSPVRGDRVACLGLCDCLLTWGRWACVQDAGVGKSSIIAYLKNGYTVDKVKQSATVAVQAVYVSSTIYYHISLLLFGVANAS